MSAVPIHLDSGEDREVDLVLLQKLLQPLSRPGLLLKELVAREAQDCEAAGLVASLQLSKLMVVLHGHSSFASDVGDEEDLATILSEGNRLAV